MSTSNYDAEFGSASGALVQATTKSGTNQWHGSLFQYLRNNVTNASDPSPGKIRRFAGTSSADRWAPSEGQAIRILRLSGGAPSYRRRVLTTVPTAADAPAI